MTGRNEPGTLSVERISPYHSAAYKALDSPHCVVTAGTNSRSASRTDSGRSRLSMLQKSRTSATARSPIAACAARNSATSVAAIRTGHTPRLSGLNQLTRHSRARHLPLLRTHFLNLTLRQTKTTLNNSGALQRLIRRHGLNRPVRRGLRRDITRRSPVNVRFPRFLRQILTRVRKHPNVLLQPQQGRTVNTQQILRVLHRLLITVHLSIRRYRR